MKAIMVHHYDAFSRVPNQGNPAGVVLNGDQLSDQEMQEIAYEVGFNETAFSVKSDVADVRIRFFTPGHEMNLCGHATMATVYALKTKGLLGHQTDLTVETRAGVLPIKIKSLDGDLSITMQQAAPEFKEFNGSKKELAHSMGLHEGDIESELPILYGSTGTWTLLVPIKGIAAFERMTPRNKLFPAILQEMPKSSVHPFCMETFDSVADMHARHFSSPYSGTIEDAVTGTASGVMGAYFAKYIKGDTFEDPLNLIVEQGQEIQKDGRVKVQVARNNEQYNIQVTGNAVHVKDFEVLLRNKS
ncbi:PhzF family phenazine biosynthesis protein [Bacillaceae bacterium SIJ1]|uniref:PhzF family phenazine biosynthesis protein n=1 Tax=Litoribacterium kuwaitense TaxID=1398745 RepID=UPI0013EC9A14|nr:PhzF family phenazine biosynthesis protein [Litoribacterium kuwaitense]NGP43494.1 PhzF family phenazine biosynthesis protein [Litoribacterium kuwaitense]